MAAAHGKEDAGRKVESPTEVSCRGDVTTTAVASVLPNFPTITYSKLLFMYSKRLRSFISYRY